MVLAQAHPKLPFYPVYTSKAKAKPVWKGPRLYHENAWITADYLRISAYDTCGYSQEILCGSSP